MAQNKIVVTGGAGFIGSNLVNKLIERKNEVLVIDNLSVGIRELVPEGCQFLKMDISSDKIIEPLHEFDPDIVVHLAALHYIPFCNKNPEMTFETNVMGTRNILESCNPELFFFASSAAVYPNSSLPLSEELYGPIDVYGKTKLIGEDLVKLHKKTYIIGRIFNVYGPHDHNPHLIPDIINQVKTWHRKIEIGNLTPKRDYIHVDDVTDAIIILLNSLKHGVYNIGTGNEYSVIDVIKIISEIINEKIDLVQKRERFREAERNNLVADISRINKEVNWSPRIALRDGLHDLLYNGRIYHDHLY